MADYSERSVLLVVQPWTFLKGEPRKFGEFENFISELESRGVYVVCFSFSSHLVESIYDLADLNVIFLVKDPVDLEAYDKTFIGREDEEESEFYDYSTPKEWKTDYEDWERSYMAHFDPLEEAESWSKRQIKFYPWQEFNYAGDVEKLSRGFERKKDDDVKAGKTKVLKITEQGGTAINFVADKAGKSRDKYIVIGGWGQECLSDVIDALDNIGVKIRLYAPFIAMKKGQTFGDWLGSRSGIYVQRAKNLKIYKDAPDDFLEKYFER
jgi:hypothetical protein